MVAKKHTGFNTLLNKNVPHILEMIFLSLDYESIKKCQKVCNSWREMLGSESFKRKLKAQFHDQMVDDLFKATYAGNAEEVALFG